MSGVILSRHALDRLDGRAIVTADEVLAACNQHLGRIEGERQKGNLEVRVIVKRLACRQECSDGSCGEIVVAAIDPRNRKVKTVMLTKEWQIVARQKQGFVYLY